MPLALIDYIPFYFTDIAGTPVPPSISGKFVQIRRGDTLFLVLSPKEFMKFHANIIERFCMDKGIEGAYDGKKEKFTIRDRSWDILGGGKFELDRSKRTIRLYGDSQAYGKFRPEGLKDAIAALPGFAGFGVTVE